MKVRKVNLITEESKSVKGIDFISTAEDQFPYIESILNTVDSNFKWWKDNHLELENMIASFISKLEIRVGTVSSRFSVYHGPDQSDKDVIYTGPVMIYTLSDTSEDDIIRISKAFGNTYKGRRIFVFENQLIFLFG